VQAEEVLAKTEEAAAQAEEALAKTLRELAGKTASSSQEQMRVLQHRKEVAEQAAAKAEEAAAQADEAAAQAEEAAISRGAATTPAPTDHLHRTDLGTQSPWYRRHWRMFAAVASVVAVGVIATIIGLLTSGGGSQGSKTSTVTVTSSTEPTKHSGLQEYPSAQALADDLTKHGHTCNMTPRGGGMFSVDSGDCDIDGKQMILDIYTGQSQIDAHLQFVIPAFEHAHMDYGWLVGKNWTVNCGSRATCQKLQADLGGRITTPLLPVMLSKIRPANPADASPPRCHWLARSLPPVRSSVRSDRGRRAVT
jgi:hypothetical protein